MSHSHIIEKKKHEKKVIYSALPTNEPKMRCVRNKKREGKGLVADKSLQIHTNEQEKRESETYANEDEDLSTN